MKKCSKCKEEKELSEFNKQASKRDGYSYICKTCKKGYYNYNLNKEHILKINRIYYKNNKKSIILNKIYYNKQRRSKDLGFRLLGNLRKRILIALKDNKKVGRTKELIGCSIEQLQKHLQNTAILNGYNSFDINNYSGREYHIDHIVPCVYFDLSKEEDQRKCFNWSNLQILTAEENLIKGGKYGTR